MFLNLGSPDNCTAVLLCYLGTAYKLNFLRLEVLKNFTYSVDMVKNLK